MDNGAIPMSYIPSTPSTVPTNQAPYYLIPQSMYTIRQHFVPPQYVYSPKFSSKYRQSNRTPIFTVVPSQNYHYDQCPIDNIVPKDMNKKRVTLQDNLEKSLKLQKQPRTKMMQWIPQSFVLPNTYHHVYTTIEGTKLGQPTYYTECPFYQIEDIDDAKCSHLQFEGLENQQANQVQYVHNPKIPITALVNKFAIDQKSTIYRAIKLF